MKIQNGIKIMNENSKLINIIINVLLVLLVLPLLTPLIVLCTACLCLPLLVSGALIYYIHYEGLFVSMPWLAWPISIWLIALGLFGSGIMIFDTFYLYKEN